MQNAWCFFITTKEVIKIEAITREEVLLQSIAEGKEVTLEPKTRLEWWLKKIAESGGSGGVSSWNDLTDKPFYKTKQEILPESILTVTDMMATAVIGVELALGANVEVNWNGTIYNTVYRSQYIDDNFYMNYIGNLSIYGALLGVEWENTGEPFFGMIMDGQAMFLVTDGSTEITVSISAEVYVPINEKYLPNNGEADWNKTDVGAGFIRNKPFYHILETVYEWDGDITDKESAKISDTIVLYKISSEVPVGMNNRAYLVEQWTSASGIIADLYNGVLQDFYSYGDYEFYYGVSGIPEAVIVLKDLTSCEGLSLTKGVYFIHSLDTSGAVMRYITKLSIYYIDELNPVYLPSGGTFESVECKNQFWLWGTKDGNPYRYSVKIVDGELIVR